MNQYVTPFSVHSMPYVAMNGGSFSTVTINPFRMPTTAPNARPVATPSAIEPLAFITVAARHADRPTFAPTERSRPAVRIVKVSPDAIRNVRLACRRMLRTFGRVKNASVVNASPVAISAACRRQ
jgi:hypothetical protein